MPTKIYVTSHISLHTWSRRTKFFHIPDGRETTLATGHQDVNKNTYEANNLCSLTFKVFQKHTFFHIKHLWQPSPKRPVAETARRRTLAYVRFCFSGKVLRFVIICEHWFSVFFMVTTKCTVLARPSHAFQLHFSRHASNNIKLENNYAPPNVTEKRTHGFELKDNVRCPLSQTYPCIGKLLKNKPYQNFHWFYLMTTCIPLL